MGTVLPNGSVRRVGDSSLTVLGFTGPGLSSWGGVARGLRRRAAGERKWRGWPCPGISPARLRLPLTPARGAGNAGQGRYGVPRALETSHLHSLAQPSFNLSRHDNQRERVWWVSWLPFQPESPRWVPRSQSCMARAPGGAGHHCDPVQATPRAQVAPHPNQTWCLDSPTPAGTV